MRTFSMFMALAGASLAAAGCGSDGTSGPGTTTVLESVSPAGGATGVDPTGTMTMRFSGPMASGMQQYVDLHQGGVAGPIVPMSCALSADRTAITCTPGQPLQHGASYTLHLGSGMMDAGGHQADIEQPAMGMGGQAVTGGMMGGMHGGQPTGMMGADWSDPADGHLGVAFDFTTE
jgi:hypothetical protein